MLTFHSINRSIYGNHKLQSWGSLFVWIMMILSCSDAAKAASTIMPPVRRRRPGAAATLSSSTSTTTMRRATIASMPGQTSESCVFVREEEEDDDENHEETDSGNQSSPRSMIARRRPALLAARSRAANHPPSSTTTTSERSVTQCLSKTRTRTTQSTAIGLQRGGGGSSQTSRKSRHSSQSSKSEKKSQSSSKSAVLDGLRSGLASGMAAACVKTLLQPLDAIKTLQQYQQTTTAAAATSTTTTAVNGAAKAAAASAAKPLSTWAAAQTLMQRPGGWTNFYAGLGVTVVGSIPGVAIYFGIYQFCKKKLLQETEWGKQNPRASIALAAAVGNSMASCSRVPYEVLKQQLQMGTYDSFGAAARAVLANPLLLFPKGGVWVQTVRDVPYAIVTLLVYESLQDALKNRQQQQQAMSARQKKAWDFLIGGVSGGMGSWVTNPMDVIKTRLQTDVNGQLYGGSMVKCANAVWQEGGASAFLRGSVPRLMHKVPANCFFFFFYETFRRLLSSGSSTDGSSLQRKRKAETEKDKGNSRR